MTEKKQEFKRDLDLWQYEMPKDSMTKQDRDIAGDCGVLVLSNPYADYLVGEWHTLMKFMNDYLEYDANTHYISPLFAKKGGKE